MNPSEQKCFRITKFPQWDPGRRVVAVVPPPERGEWILIMVIYGVLFGLMAGYALFLGFGDFVDGISMSFVESFIVCAIPLSVIGALHLAGGDLTSGRVELDWEKGTLSTSSRNGTVRFALAEISTLLLRGEYEVRLDSQGKSELGRVYHARLDALAGKRTVLLMATDSREFGDENAAVEQLAPIAKQLAEALQIELKRDEPVEQRHRKFVSAIFSAPRWMHAIFAGLFLTSILWVVWRAGLLGL